MLKLHKAGEIMYLLSLYFEINDTQILQNYIQYIEQKSKNTYLRDHHIPVHLTVATIRKADILQFKQEIDCLIKTMYTGTLELAAIGAFGQHTLYIMPVLNRYLFDLSFRLNQMIDQFDHNRDHNRYRPYSWIPHITVARKLDHQQFYKAFEGLSDIFKPFKIKVTKIVLSQRKPYQDIEIWELREKIQ